MADLTGDHGTYGIIGVSLNIKDARQVPDCCFAALQQLQQTSRLSVSKCTALLEPKKQLVCSSAPPCKLYCYDFEHSCTSALLACQHR